MPMKAVQFAEENYAIILAEANIPPEFTVVMRKNPPKNNGDYYFIPNYVNKDGDTPGWICLREDLFDLYFTCDKDKIKTQFVTITRK